MKYAPPRLIMLALLALLMVLATACGAAPQQEPDPAPAEEEASTDAEEPTEETTEEDASATDADEPEVDTSQAAVATELEAGVTVVTDEPDVSTPRDRTGGQYRSVSTSDGVNFHPYLITDTTSRGYAAMVYDRALLTIDEETLEYIPYMAESYTISEDGLTFTFKLRENITWSDGVPLTAHDFVWAYDQATNPDNGYPYLSQFDFIESYTAPDDYTIEVKITEVYAPALGQASGLVYPLPRHIWEDLDWSDPETNPEITRPSVTSGPYKLKEWERDQYIIFEANEDYWYYGAPNITESVQEIVPDQDIAYQKMRSGDVDTAPITAEQLEDAREIEDVTIYEWWPAAAIWSYIGLNMREGFPTSDINVRHGINYAIDKQLLTDEVQLGQAKRLCSIYPETSWVYNPDVECYEYDPEKAIESFEAAGYTYDGETMLDENGEPLTLNLLFGPNTSKTAELISVIVQDYLSEIGVTVEIQALEWASFLEATDSDNPDWDMFLGAWRATIEPHIMYTIWSEDSIPDLNSVAYINKDVEQLFEEAGGTYDTEYRVERYQQIQQIIAEESPYVFLYYRKGWSGVNNRIQGIDPTALGITYNREDWYIEETPVN